LVDCIDRGGRIGFLYNCKLAKQTSALGPGRGTKTGEGPPQHATCNSIHPPPCSLRRAYLTSHDSALSALSTEDSITDAPPAAPLRSSTRQHRHVNIDTSTSKNAPRTRNPTRSPTLGSLSTFRVGASTSWCSWCLHLYFLGKSPSNFVAVDQNTPVTPATQATTFTTVGPPSPPPSRH